MALGDPGQRFLASAGIPHARFDVELGLEEQLRTPRPIADLARAIRDRWDLWFETSEHLHVVRVADGEPRWAAIVRAVGRQRKQSFADRDLCILSLAGVMKMTQRPEDARDDVLPVAADADEASESLVMDTALRFKGLERPWVIVTDLGTDLSDAVRVRLYVALTRSTVGVTLVLTVSELAALTGQSVSEV